VVIVPLGVMTALETVFESIARRKRVVRVSPCSPCRSLGAVSTVMLALSMCVPFLVECDEVFIGCVFNNAFDNLCVQAAEARAWVTRTDRAGQLGLECCPVVHYKAGQSVPPRVDRICIFVYCGGLCATKQVVD